MSLNYLTKLNRTYFYFIITALVICIFYSIIFVPVVSGDSSDYINIAKIFLGESTNITDYSLRSPLYPLLLSVIIKSFGEQAFLRVSLYLQYLMVFISALLIFQIFKRIISNLAIIFLIGLLYIANISTITFGYLILSESLTLLLFISATFVLIKYIENRKGTTVIALGLITGLLILARYNLILVPVWTVIIVLFMHFFIIKPRKFKLMLLHSFYYAIALFFILNIWCLYNLYNQGSYRLFPVSEITINRNAVLSTLNENNKVSAEYKATLNIFLGAKKVVDARNEPLLKGSFIKFDVNNYMHKLYSGYEIYVAALPELMKIYNCNSSNHEIVLSKKLALFYREIADQNGKELFVMRILSVLNGFRYSVVSLPESFGNTNLNVLPEEFFKVYKILFIITMLAFFVLTVFYIAIQRKNNINTYYQASILLMLVLYFPVINFLFVTESNANRFKYPSEPLIIGLTIYYIYFIFQQGKQKS